MGIVLSHGFEKSPKPFLGTIIKFDGVYRYMVSYKCHIMDFSLEQNYIQLEAIFLHDYIYCLLSYFVYGFCNLTIFLAKKSGKVLTMDPNFIFFYSIYLISLITYYDHPIITIYYLLLSQYF